MRAIVSAVLAFSVWIGQAEAADTIVQNRDEPGRHPVQQTVTGECGANRITSCTCPFPPVPDNHRYVITGLNALAKISKHDPSIAQLFGSAFMAPEQSAAQPQFYSVDPPEFSFAMAYAGQFTPRYYEYTLNEPVTAYFAYKENPQLEVQVVSMPDESPLPIMFSLTCTITGYTVQMP